MTVEDLINELKKYNPEAEVNVVALFKEYDFIISCGNSKESIKENCDVVSFYVDELTRREYQRIKREVERESERK